MNVTPLDPDLRVRLDTISIDLAEQFDAWRGEDWPDARFDELARRIFELQFEASVTRFSNLAQDERLPAQY